MPTAAVEVRRRPKRSAGAKNVRERRLRYPAEAVGRMHRAVAERWPRLFGRPEAPLPLALGIDVVLARELGVSRKRARRFLGWWCRRRPYLEALARDRALRFGLDGQPEGVVLAEHRDRAREKLGEIARRSAGRGRPCGKLAPGPSGRA